MYYVLNTIHASNYITSLDTIIQITLLKVSLLESFVDKGVENFGDTNINIPMVKYYSGKTVQSENNR